MKTKPTYIKISLSIDPLIIKKLNNSNYNRSRLVNSLLSSYFKKLIKN